MLCPICGFESSKVLESRTSSDKSSIRRRRECEGCQKRYTTYEKIEMVPLFVIKKNGAREEYSRDKLLNSIMMACKKCAIPEGIIEEIADRIELDLSIYGKREISTIYLGERILDTLKNINEVAYLRYLSIFREFKSAEDFRNEINSLSKQLSFV